MTGTRWGTWMPPAARTGGRQTPLLDDTGDMWRFKWIVARDGAGEKWHNLCGSLNGLFDTVDVKHVALIMEPLRNNADVVVLYGEVMFAEIKDDSNRNINVFSRQSVLMMLGVDVDNYVNMMGDNGSGEMMLGRFSLMRVSRLFRMSRIELSESMIKIFTRYE